MSLNHFQRFTRGECPICQGARRDCRQNTSSGIIHCRDTDANPIDYLFRGQDALGFGMWSDRIESEARDEDRRREWKEQRERERQSERERHARSLIPIERDREIRSILDQLTLSESDRAILSKRAYLSEARIENYRSVSQWQPLAIPVSPRLAGTNFRGDRLNNPVAGILIPIPDENGLFVGLRLYNPHHEENGHGKYTPLSSVSRNVRPNLPNGEAPISVYWPEKLQQTDRIGLTEGVEFKPAIAADRLGIPVIGASGGNFASSPESLKTAIETIRERLGNPNASIVLYPDAGSLANPSVTGQYRKLAGLLPIEIADWGHGLDKRSGDIDEIETDRLNPIELLSPAEFFALAPEREPKKPEPKKKPSLIERLIERVRRFKGFGKPPAIEPIEPGKSINFIPSIEEWESLGRPAIEYEGDPSKFWQEAIGKGFGAIHDASFMGSGKSHAIPNLASENGKIWYLSSEHRNPSIEAITEQFTDLAPRSRHGFYRDESGKLVPANETTDPSLIEIEGNCIRADLFGKLSSIGYDPNTETDSFNPICQSCPKLHFCGITPGLYRHDRRETLKNPHIRGSIESSPRDGYDYSPDILTIEEASRELKPTKTISTTHEKLLVELDRVRAIISPEAFAYLDSLVQSLKPLYEEKSQYGITTERVKEVLGVLPDFKDIDDLIRFLSFHPPDLAEIFEKGDRVVGLTREERDRWKDAIKYANRELGRDEYGKILEKLENLPPNALIHLLKLARGDRGITARVQGKKITLTVDDRWYAPILEQAQAVIFLDATIDAERLKLLSGIERPILTMRKKIDRPLANLTIHQIEVSGLGSNDISPAAIERVNALTGQLKELHGEFPIIAFKAYQEAMGAMGYWFRDNRSSNDYQGTHHLAFVGSPYPNVGAISDEFLALTGSCDGFDRYYQALIRSEQLQGIGGRQRCHRFPDREFHIWAIGTGQDLSWLESYGAKLDRRHGFEITPLAGDRFQFSLWQIVETARAGARSGREIADRLGKSPGTVNKFLRENAIELTELIERLKPDTDPIDPHIGRVSGHDAIFADEWFRCLFGLDPITLAEEMMMAIDSGGWEDFRDTILPIFPHPLQTKILSVLAGLKLEAIDSGG